MPELEEVGDVRGTDAPLLEMLVMGAPGITLLSLLTPGQAFQSAEADCRLRRCHLLVAAVPTLAYCWRLAELQGHGIDQRGNSIHGGGRACCRGEAGGRCCCRWRCRVGHGHVPRHDTEAGGEGLHKQQQRQERHIGGDS